MELLEITCTTDKNGALKIPSRILREMGIIAGDQVRLAYLSNNGTSNFFHEFFVSANGLEALPTESEFRSITLPNDLMAEAGITDTDDIQIACAERAIIIFQSKGQQLSNELKAILNGLNIASDALERLSVQADWESNLHDALQDGG